MHEQSYQIAVSLAKTKMEIVSFLNGGSISSPTKSMWKHSICPFSFISKRVITVQNEERGPTCGCSNLTVLPFNS